MLLRNADLLCDGLKVASNNADGGEARVACESVKIAVVVELETRGNRLRRRDGPAKLRIGAGNDRPSSRREDTANFSQGPHRRSRRNPRTPCMLTEVKRSSAKGRALASPAWRAGIFSASLHAGQHSPSDYFAYFLYRSLTRPQWRLLMKLSIYAARFGPSLW